jgi:hypothetical protein
MLIVLLAGYYGFGLHLQPAKAQVAVAKGCPGLVKGIYFYRGATRRWEHKLGKEPSRSNFNASLIRSCAYAKWVAHHWIKKSSSAHHNYIRTVREKARQVRSLASVPYGKWECIHEHEGAWNSNTGNGYYGGLQMDYGFMGSYGSEFLSRWGTADNWPVWAQITAAERAYSSRGFSPWPNTARACGLL